MPSTTLGGWLVHVMRAADGTLSIEEALHVIMESIKDFFPCQSAAVILIDQDTKELRIKISRHISYTFVKAFHRHGPSPTAEKCVLEQRPMLLNDVPPGSDLYGDLKLEHEFASAVLAPIVTNQRGVGYVFCDRANGERFDESDLLHLQVLGYLIGSLIERFELLQTSKRLSQIDDASQAMQYKAFIPALAVELQRAASHHYAVPLALLSVGAFRNYVEVHGIKLAHALLAEVVAVIKKRLRDMDLLARFGADEFILCLSGMTRDEAEALLKAIQEAVEREAVGQSDLPIRLTVAAVVLDTPKALGLRMQDILSALGAQLVEAKRRNEANAVLIAPM